MDKTKIFFKKNGLLLNWKEFERLDKAQKINTLSMISPVTNEEKQKLLESLTIADKIETLENIINFYLHETNFNTHRPIVISLLIYSLVKKSNYFWYFKFRYQNSIPSIVPIGLIILLKTFILDNSSFANNNSSLRVPDLVISKAGYILFATFLSKINSELPVPLNSSKITSSILLPVSIKAVEIIVREPPLLHF